MFFLGEYAGLFIMSVLASAVFLGGYAWPLGQNLGVGFQLVLTLVKSAVLIFLVMWIRATVPRLRIDQLMAYSWKILLPLSLAQVLVNGFVLVYDLPRILLTIFGVIGVIVLVSLTERAIRLPRDRKSTRLNSSHMSESRMPSSA